MQPIRSALSIILLASVVTSSYQSSAKLRRDGVLNLYPFPRVGRANSHTWAINGMFLNPVPPKRQLYAFPRVGRSELRRPEFQLSPQIEELLFGRRNPYVKRQSPFEEMEAKDTPGMWFGPRLGRSFPSEDNDTFDTDAEKREPEQLEANQINRDKRQSIYT